MSIAAADQVAPQSPKFPKETTPKFVEDHFITKTAKVFWHYVANSYETDNLYTPEVIAQRVATITQKTGGNSFQSQDEHLKMTPLHIAAIKGNRVAIVFFLTHYADLEITDSFGNKPSDYAQKHHPNLLDLFTDVRIHKVEALFKEFYQQSKWILKLTPLQAPYRQHTQDFGVEIKSLLIGHPVDFVYQNKKRINRRIINDIATVCSKVGVEASISKNNVLFFPRDNWVRSHHGEVVEPFFYFDQDPSKVKDVTQETLHPLTEAGTKTHKKALDSTKNHSLSFQLNGASRTETPFLASYSSYSSLGRRFADLVQGNDASQTEFDDKTKLRKGTVHFDGGNAFILTNQKGKPHALFGRDHLASNYMLSHSVKTMFDATAENLSKSKGMNKEEWKEKIKVVENRSLSSKDVEVGALELFVLGVLEKPEDFKWTPESEGIYRCHVVEYVFQTNLCQTTTARDFSLLSNDLHYISQANYHLDTFMKPGPNHSVFVQDYRLSLDLLLHLKKHAVELNFSDKDNALLEEYIQASQRLDAEIGPLLATIKTEIEQAHFTVLPMPGVFINDSIDHLEDAQSINFMNALSGWSSKIEDYYYITSGCQAGDQLGKALMDSFAVFLKQYVPTIKVHFVGRDPKKLDDFSETTIWSQEHAQAGVHCFTFEMETKDHA